MKEWLPAARVIAEGFAGKPVNHWFFGGTRFSITRSVSGIEVVTVSQTTFQSTR
jgi:hypothetical protein